MLIFKLHPQHLAWLNTKDERFDVIPFKNVVDIGVYLDDLIASMDSATVYIESPYIEIEGPKPAIYHNIQLLQRTAGIIEYLCYKYLNIKPIYLIHETKKPSVSERLLMVDKLLKPQQFYSTTSYLSLADCLLLYLSISRPRASQTPKTPLQNNICGVA